MKYSLYFIHTVYNCINDVTKKIPSGHVCKVEVSSRLIFTQIPWTTSTCNCNVECAMNYIFFCKKYRLEEKKR